MKTPFEIKIVEKSINLLEIKDSLENQKTQLRLLRNQRFYSNLREIKDSISNLRKSSDLLKTKVCNHYWLRNQMTSFEHKGM